jgi:hypothetical protein
MIDDWLGRKSSVDGISLLAPLSDSVSGTANVYSPFLKGGDSSNLLGKKEDVNVNVILSYGYVVQVAGPPVAVAPKFNLNFIPRSLGGTNEFNRSRTSLY